MPYQQLPITPYEPQQVDPIGLYSRLAAIKGAQQEQQLREQQVIGAGQENQIRADHIKDQQAIDNAYHDALTQDESGNVKVDSNKLSQALAASGHGSAVPGILKNIQDYQKSATDLQEAKGKVQAQAQEAMGFLGSAIQQAKYDPNLADMLIEQHLRSPNASPQEVQQLQQMRQAIQQNPELLKTLADSYVAQAPKQQEMQNARTVAGIRSNGVDKIEMNDWLSKNPGKTPADYQQFKVDQGVSATIAKETNPSVLKARKDLAVSTAQAEAPTKIATAAAEERQRQQIQGQVKPGYAFEPETGKTILTNQTDYLNSNGKLQAFRPVTEKELSEDRQLNNRLADVAQKISRYENSMQSDLSQADKDAIAGIIGHDKFKLGAFGAEIPVDSLNQVIRAASFNRLSPAARTRIIAYRNAEEAMVGYQRVLSGSGRSSDKAMELNIATLPHPLVNSDVANEGMSQFKENIKIASQGLPTLPGIKGPDEVVKAMSGKTQNESSMPKTGETKEYQGSTYKFDGKQWVRQ